MPDYEKEYGHAFKKNYDYETDYPNVSKSFPYDDQPEYCYITLITRANYLAGVVMLAHTLKKSGSKYPLVVLYTSTLGEQALIALKEEVMNGGIILLQETTLLIPPVNENTNPIEVAADRFQDTWSKLRIFGTQRFGFRAMCYLDADMVVLKNPDDVFKHVDTFFFTHIMAVQDCVCSPDKMPWTPESHVKENCAFTPLTHPEALTTTVKLTDDCPSTYRLFNTGMMLFQPREEVWAAMIDYFMHTDKLSEFRFPDQDFLTYYFRNNRIHPLPWKYNAVKTMAYRHENIFRLDDVVVLHYIVDKPWAKRVGEDGIAGFKGKDGETHKLWWKLYEEWIDERTRVDKYYAINLVAKHVDPAPGESSDEDRPAMGAVGPQANISLPPFL